MAKLKQRFSDSLKEFKEVRTLAVSAMLLAIAVVLGFYTLQVTDYMKIGFSYLANELAGMLFGPAAGAMIGGLADLLKYVVHPTGPFFPGFTISGIMGGLIYGLVLYQRPLSLRRVFLANGLVTVIVNLCLNTYWLTLLYGSAFMAILPARIIKEAIMLPVTAILFYTVAQVLSKSQVLSLCGYTAKKVMK